MALFQTKYPTISWAVVNQIISLFDFLLQLFKIVLWWQVTILWSHWCSLFWNSVHSAHGFQSQGGSIITCTLLSLVCNDPQSQLWIPRPWPGPNFTPRYGEATARVTAHCHFRNCHIYCNIEYQVNPNLRDSFAWIHTAWAPTVAYDHSTSC